MQIPNELRDHLDSVDEVIFAHLFGSRLTQAKRADSDWDIGVYLDDRLDEKGRFHLRLRLLALLQDLGSVDLVVLNDAPPLVALRALQGKRILMKQPETFVRFFVRTLTEADDDRYWNQFHADARRKRIEEGRFGRP
jgi:predicted nucleotidyltransferase